MILFLIALFLLVALVLPSTRSRFGDDNNLLWLIVVVVVLFLLFGTGIRTF